MITNDNLLIDIIGGMLPSYTVVEIIRYYKKCIG